MGLEGCREIGGASRDEQLNGWTRSGLGAMSQHPNHPGNFDRRHFRWPVLAGVDLRQQSARSALSRRLDSGWRHELAALLPYRHQNRQAVCKINHALALLRTGRAAEAERILATIASERLPKDGLANFNLAMAEAHLALGRKAKAAEVAGKVDRSRLLGPQLTRLDFIIAQAQGGRAP